MSLAALPRCSCKHSTRISRSASNTAKSTTSGRNTLLLYRLRFPHILFVNICARCALKLSLRTTSSAPKRSSFCQHRAHFIGLEERSPPPSSCWFSCPAARQLHDLCGPILGFGNLTFLGLHIRTDFRHYAVDDEFLRAVESANFVITASKVELVVTDNAGFVTAEHEEVKKRIVAK